MPSQFSRMNLLAKMRGQSEEYELEAQELNSREEIPLLKLEAIKFNTEEDLSPPVKRKLAPVKRIEQGPQKSQDPKETNRVREYQFVEQPITVFEENPNPWSKVVFLNHFLNGRGKKITLRETGYLGKVIAKTELKIF